MKVAVLFNPKAGSAAQIEALRTALDARPGVTLHELGPGSDIRQVVADLCRNQYDLIAVAGGDGTFHAAVQGVVSNHPRQTLAVIPLGTGNDLCRTLAVPLNPTDAVNVWKTGQARSIDVIRVEGDHTGYMVNAVTGGFSGRVAADVTPEMKEFWGPLAYLRGAAGPIADRQSYRVRLRLDDGPSEEMEIYNLVVANGRTAAGGLLVAPSANPEDGLLDVLIIPASDLLDASVVAARLMAGDYQADETVLHRRAKRVEVESDPPLPVSLDGEQAEGRRFTFTVHPGVLRVLAGRDYRPDPVADSGEAEAIEAAAPVSRNRLFGLIAGLLMLVRRFSYGVTLALGLAALAVLGFAMLARIVLAGEWEEANREILAEMHAGQSPGLVRFAEVITHAGHWAVTTGVGVALVVWYTVRKRYLDAATLGAILVGCGLLEVVLKAAFQVERPGPYEAAVAVAAHSFPSGHALRSVGLYFGVAALTVGRNPRSAWSLLMAVGCVLLATLVCWSRPYLGVHWPGDVVAGALVAIAWVVSCLVARHRVRANSVGQS